MFNICYLSNFSLSMSNLSTLDFKLTKSIILAKEYVSTPVAFSRSAFLKELTNLITLPPKDFDSGKYSLIYTVFLSIQLSKELSNPFHLTYNLSHFLFITFSILNTF